MSNQDQLIRERLTHIFQLADAEKSEFAPAQFDQIFCCEALLLFQDSLTVLRSWHLLKPGDSTAFTSTHEDSYFGNFLQDAVRIVLGPDAPLQMHGLLGTKEKIRHQLTSANLSSINIVSDARGSYKPVDAIRCTRSFLSVFFRGVPSVVDLSEEQLGQICGLFSKSIANVATTEGLWQSTGLFFVHARRSDAT